LEVINLQEQLDNQLQQRQARETGICPIREELYSQCFGMPSISSLLHPFPYHSLDELIRQITINCAERGLLLLRVRDEARMRISAYETLYESSIAYGIRKALMAEQRKTELDSTINELKASKKDLESQVDNLKKTIEATQARAMEKRQIEIKAHADEVERSQKMNEQLKTNLETMLSAPKK
jgi:dynein light intermediate chain, axonemal